MPLLTDKITACKFVTGYLVHNEGLPLHHSVAWHGEHNLAGTLLQIDLVTLNLMPVSGNVELLDQLMHQKYG